MACKEAIKYCELFNSEIPFFLEKFLEEQREAAEKALEGVNGL